MLYKGWQVILNQHDEVLQAWHQVFVTLFVLLLGNLEEFAFMEVYYVLKILFDQEVAVQHHPTFHNSRRIIQQLHRRPDKGLIF